MRGTLALCFSLSFVVWSGSVWAGGNGAEITRDSDGKVTEVLPPALERGNPQAGDHSQSENARSQVPGGGDVLGPFPEGLAGFDVAIAVEGTIQFFTDSQLQTSGTGLAIQDSTGSVRLTVEPCDPEAFYCSSLAAVRAALPGTFPAGTSITFDIFQTQAITPDLAGFSMPAHCRLDRLPTAATIAGSVFEVDAGAVGEHEIVLAATEPEGIVLHCQINATNGF